MGSLTCVKTMGIDFVELSGSRCRRGKRKDRIGPNRDELACDLAILMPKSTAPAPKRPQVSALDKALAGELLAHHVSVRLHRVAAPAEQHADAIGTAGLLGEAGERRRTQSKQRGNRFASVHSTASSARNRID